MPPVQHGVIGRRLPAVQLHDATGRANSALSAVLGRRWHPPTFMRSPFGMRHFRASRTQSATSFQRRWSLPAAGRTSGWSAGQAHPVLDTDPWGRIAVKRQDRAAAAPCLRLDVDRDPNPIFGHSGRCGGVPRWPTNCPCRDREDRLPLHRPRSLCRPFPAPNPSQIGGSRRPAIRRDDERTPREGARKDR